MNDKIEDSGLAYKGMGSFFRIALFFGVMLALFLGLILAGASWWVLRRMGPEFWVTLLEENCNCRCQIDNSKLSLFSSPSKLIFEGVRIAPRDTEVGKPLTARIPLAEGVSPIVIPQIVMEIEIDNLLSKKLLIQRLKILAPEIREQQDSHGRSSLTTLFQRPSPGVSGPDASPVNTEVVRSVSATLPEAEQVTSGAQARLSGYGFGVTEAYLHSGHLMIISKDVNVHFTDLDINLNGIDINPSDTYAHNSIHATIRSRIQVGGQARIGGVKRPAELANLQFKAEGDMIPFNSKTGTWSPSTTLKLTLDRGSVLAGHITMGDVASKEMKKLQEYGVDLAPVQIGGALLEPAVIRGIFADNRLTLLAESSFIFPEYEVLIEENSWINGVQDQHEMDLHLSCGAALQARLKQGVAKAKLGDALSHSVINALLDKRGRMTFDIESKGSLADPQVRPKLDRVLKNLISGENLGNLLQGLLKKL